MTPHTPSIAELKYLIDGEIIKALALREDSRLRRWLEPIFSRGTQRFSQIGARFDGLVREHGFPVASDLILPEFIQGFHARGEENIPKDGPLVMAANHPGAYDSLVIAANMPRQDFKIVAGAIPFLQHLPHAYQNFIFTPDRNDPHGRMNVIRAAIRHLQAGGSLLIYPSGTMDPDPLSMVGARGELQRLSRSLEIFLNKVPETRVLVSIVSGILLERFVHHPVTWLRRKRLDRQRLAEMLQVIRQLITSKPYTIWPKVSFGRPVAYARAHPDAPLQAMVQDAQQLLDDHMAWIG